MLLEIVLSILFSVFSLFIIYFAHEKAHQEIYRLYGIRSTIKCNGLTSWETESEEIPKWKSKEVMFAQSLNEVFGYPIMALSMIISVLIIVIILL